VASETTQKSTASSWTPLRQKYLAGGRRHHSAQNGEKAAATWTLHGRAGALAIACLYLLLLAKYKRTCSNKR